MKRSTVAIAIAIGPLAAYLAWALAAKRPVHIAIAAFANLVLWIFGPALLAHLLH